MAVKLRLMRMGKKKQPTYRVVAADGRSPRDGRFIEIVGTYEPRAEPSVVKIDNDKAVPWLQQGRAADRAGREAAEDLGRVGRVPGRQVRQMTEADNTLDDVPADDDVDDDDFDDELDANSTANSDDDEEDEDDSDDVNRIPAATARAVLDYLVRALVDDPDSVEVDAVEGRRGVSLRVRVAPGDMGRVIGKRGRTANAVRTVTRAAAVRDGVEVDVDFVD